MIPFPYGCPLPIDKESPAFRRSIRQTDTFCLCRAGQPVRHEICCKSAGRDPYKTDEREIPGCKTSVAACRRRHTGRSKILARRTPSKHCAPHPSAWAGVRFPWSCDQRKCLWRPTAVRFASFPFYQRMFLE